MSNFSYRHLAWYGSSFSFKHIDQQYEDNSLSKPIKMKFIQNKRSQQLSLEYHRINSSLSIHKDINSRVDLYSQRLSSYFDSISNLELENTIMENAAITIQKHRHMYC